MQVYETYSTDDPSATIERVVDTNSSQPLYYIRTDYDYKELDKPSFYKYKPSKRTLMSTEYKIEEDGDSLVLLEDQTGASLFVNGEPIRDEGRINMVKEYVQLNTSGKQLELEF